jgi:hypothetical protein
MNSDLRIDGNTEIQTVVTFGRMNIKNAHLSN